ncbi:MAG: hypothetical protein J6C37_07900 [Roseburia sp.]|nr:hypothetical protein [Roseburia sp.]
MNGQRRTQLNTCHADFLRANPRRKTLWHVFQITVTRRSTAKDSRLMVSL